MVSERTILYLFRKSDPRFHSIESVFNMIIPLVGQSFRTVNTELNHEYASVTGIRKNLMQIQVDPSNILYHITGHVNYMALKTGRLTVLTIHDIRSALVGNIFARMAKLIFWFWIPALLVKRITVISYFSLGELRKLIPFVGHKTSVIPNPVPPDLEYQPKEMGDKGLNVLCMGTKANKNLERCIKALKGLPVTFTIVGELSYKQQTLLNEIGLQYENHTDLSQDRLVQCYRETDLLCFPSTYEGFGMPIIEAQATGRPVVTSNLGAMKEVAGDGACLVDPFDVISIREGVIKVIENETYRRQLIEQGLENVKRFKAEAVAKQYIEVYKQVFGNHIEEVSE